MAVELNETALVVSKNPNREKVIVALTAFFSDDEKLIKNEPSAFALSRLNGLERIIWTLSSGVKFFRTTVPLIVTVNWELVGSAGLAHENNAEKTSVIRYVAYCRYFICSLTIID